jgi:hypothetical protein
MSDTQVWGGLAKATDDAETIEEAIDRKIADHEVDPDSHGDQGESIDVHRTNEVVDHPAGSVLPDKFDFRKFTIRSTFESLDGWVSTGTVDLLSLSFVQIEADFDNDQLSEIATGAEHDYDFADPSSLGLFQAQLRLNIGGTSYAAWGCFNRTGSDIVSGAGFLYDSGVLKAVVYDDGTPITETLTGLDGETEHIYRMVYSEDGDSLLYYVDSDLVATIPNTLDMDVLASSVRFLAKATVSSSFMFIMLKNMMYSGELGGFF